MLKLKELQVHHMIKTPQHGLYKISVSSKSQISLIFSYNFETDLRLKELFVDGLSLKQISRGQPRNKGHSNQTILIGGFEN